MVFTKQEMVGATYQKMIIEKQILPEVLLLKPKVFADERGFFVETLRESILEEVGIPNLKQQNQSRSQYGVLRGLHYQLDSPQGKLVRVSRGLIFDVAVDVRLGSPNFGKWVGALLDDKNHHQLWVPEGFAHGFLVLSEVADVCYSCSNYYLPSSEFGIIWNDNEIDIKWPELNQNQPILSDKDKKNQSLKLEQMKP